MAWSNPAAGTSYLAGLPAELLQPGSNRLELTVERDSGAVPGYLSRVYVGPVGPIVPHYWLRQLLGDQFRATTLALQLLVVIGVLTVWSARRHDPVFGWLLLLGVVTLPISIADMALLAPYLAAVQPHLAVAYSGYGMVAVGIALAFVRRPRPRWLPWAVAVLPALLLVGALTGVIRPGLAGLSSAAVAIAGYGTAAAILVRAFLRERRPEFALLAVPFALTSWFGLCDVALSFGLLDSVVLASAYLRPLMLLVTMIVLMRRLAASLNSLDAANETLRQRLTEQEAELSRLHSEERTHVAGAVRDQERQRLTRDLHDGLSGHLVSIMALAERDTGRQGIEIAAREALEDLRLVINALDIGDEDLPLALAGLRERLEPRLRRLGVAFEWSMDGLPPVTGVTPSSALVVLRILQEAVTNALKHGPARRIAIRGFVRDKRAVIAVENDVAPVDSGAAGSGQGLGNMRRRAGQLGGEMALVRTDGTARLELMLPMALPEIA